MNPAHNVICSSRWWRRRVEHHIVPWALEGVELGPRVLEIGPGFGATTHLLVKRAHRIDVLELNRRYCERLEVQLGSRAKVTCGDATSMPYADAEFTAVLCFTMLHHVAPRELQNRVFREVARVLVPGGVFAGTDSLGTGSVFRLIHIGDTLQPIDPEEMPARLGEAGLADTVVERAGRSFRFRAVRPA